LTIAGVQDQAYHSTAATGAKSTSTAASTTSAESSVTTASATTATSPHGRVGPNDIVETKSKFIRSSHSARLLLFLLNTMIRRGVNLKTSWGFFRMVYVAVGVSLVQTGFNPQLQ
jgi:hypothetical protein